METTKLTRREREKIQHREQILEAALELFAATGYHNVSMHEIAQASEFAIGTLYSFFKSKEDLYRALMLETASKFEQEIGKAFAEGDDEYEKILNFARSKTRVFVENAKVVRLYIAESRGASFNIKAGLDKEMRESYDRFLKILASHFESGIERGLFRELDPQAMAVSLDSLINSAMFLWIEDPEKYPNQKTVDQMIKIFFGPVRNGSMNPSEGAGPVAHE